MTECTHCRLTAIGLADAVLACAVLAYLTVLAQHVTAAAMVGIAFGIKNAIRTYRQSKFTNAVLARDVLATLVIAFATMGCVRARIDGAVGTIVRHAGHADPIRARGTRRARNPATTAVAVIAGDIGIDAIAVGWGDGRHTAALLADAMFTGNSAAAAVHRILAGIELDGVTHRRTCLAGTVNTGESLAAGVAAGAAVVRVGCRIDAKRGTVVWAKRKCFIRTKTNARLGIARRLRTAGIVRCPTVFVVVCKTVSMHEVIAVSARGRQALARIADRGFAMIDMIVTTIAVNAAVFPGVRFTRMIEQMTVTVARCGDADAINTLTA